MQNITTVDLYILMKYKKLNIIDVRDNYLYKKGHIYNSINIPFNTLMNNSNNLIQKNIEYYIICDCGDNSHIACLFLSSLGYNTTNVLYGYSDWHYELVE